MPTRITTRAARVALANRDYEQARAEIEAKIDARMQRLHADPRATDKPPFLSLCKADQELRVLAIQLGAANAERGVVRSNRDLRDHRQAVVGSARGHQR